MKKKNVNSFVFARLEIFSSPLLLFSFISFRTLIDYVNLRGSLAKSLARLTRCEFGLFRSFTEVNIIIFKSTK